MGGINLVGDTAVAANLYEDKFRVSQALAFGEDDAGKT